MITYMELLKLAKEQKIKYAVTFTKEELCNLLKKEISPSSEKFEKFCREKISNSVKITLVNKKNWRKTRVSKYI